ncbi:hypothetical protein [Ferruginibacter sp.]
MKMFRLLNIIHIVLIVFLFSYTSYYNQVSFDDKFAFAIILGIPLIITANCASNISLCSSYATAKYLTQGRKIFFWLFFILFILLTVVLVFAIYENIRLLNKYSIQGSEIAFSYIFKSILLLLTTCNGFYIIIYQFYFFFSTKKRLKLQFDSLIKEIGEPDII